MTIDVALPRVARFSIGRVLRDSLLIFGRNILLFGGVALVVSLLSLLDPGDASFPDPDGGTNWVAFCVATALDIVITGLTEAAIVFAAFQCLRGRRATAVDVARGLRSAVPIVLAGAIYTLPLYALDIIEAMFPEQASIVGNWTLIVTVAAALVVAVMWWVYVPVIAIEGKGVFASLGRSARLTKGRRWAIAGVLALFTIAIVVPFIVIVSTTGLSADELTAGPLTLAGAAGYVFYALAGAFFAVLVTVTYYYLRIEKEGAGVEDIVQVFD